MPNIQEVLRKISESKYLIHGINREQAQMLVGSSKPGTFLIRFRENASNSLAVHMYRQTPLAVEISKSGIIYKGMLFGTIDAFVTALMKFHSDLTDPIQQPFNYYQSALSSLTHVLLTDENLNDVAGLTPADINNSKIIHLGIDGDDIIDEVITPLSQALSTNQTIKELEICRCHLNYQDHEDVNLVKDFITNIFASNMLERVRFSATLNEGMIEAVFEGLEKNTCLKRIWFSVEEETTAKLLGKFFIALQKHPALTDIAVNAKQFSEESFTGLKLLLANNSVIEKLAIYCPYNENTNDFVDKKIPEFFSSAEFAQNTSLTDFSLGDVDIEHSHLEQNRSRSLKDTCIRFFRSVQNRKKIGTDEGIKSKLPAELQEAIFGTEIALKP